MYVHARLFEPIAEIVVLCEVGPFLKSYHIYLEAWVRQCQWICRGSAGVGVGQEHQRQEHQRHLKWKGRGGRMLSYLQAGAYQCLSVLQSATGESNTYNSVIEKLPFRCCTCLQCIRWLP